MKNYQKGVAMSVIILIIALVAIGVGVYFFTSKQSLNSNSYNSYSNSSLGISFDHPTDWEPVKYQNGQTTGSFVIKYGPGVDAGEFTVEISGSRLGNADPVNALQVYAKQVIANKIVDEQGPTQIAQQTAYKVIMNDQDRFTSSKGVTSNIPTKIISIYTFRNGELYTIIFRIPSENYDKSKEMIDKVLSSFKFI
jgi:hypothetical protein